MEKDGARLPRCHSWSSSNLLNSLETQTLSSYGYSHDKVGSRRSLTDLLGIHDYSYDLIYRLLQANHPDQPNEQYSYDPVGNRQGTTVDTGNRLLQDANYNYSYDNNGNLIQKINRTTSQLTTYGYDPENRLVQVTFPGMAVSYKYDSFGRRIEKNINGAITQYLYDDEDIILEYDGNNQIGGRYTHGPGTDEPLSMEKNGQKYYYHFDGLGSVTGMTDNSGNLIQEYSYDSFGKIQNSLAPDLKQPFTYTAREYDDESGLYYYRARYYDPTSGRFLTQDPIGLDGGINLYAYVQNDPVNLVDPWGLAPFTNHCQKPICFKPEKTTEGYNGTKKYPCPPGQTCDADGVYPPDGSNPIKFCNGCTLTANGEGDECEIEKPDCPSWKSKICQQIFGGPVPDSFWDKDKHKDWPKPSDPITPNPKLRNNRI